MLILLLALPTMAAEGDHSSPTPLELPPLGPFWADDRDSLIVDYVFKVQDIGNLAMSLTNHGFLGDNFADREVPSMVFPKGSSIDHLIRAGIWVGGINTNLDPLVTTGVQDGYYGSYTRRTEWEPGAIPQTESNIGWIRGRSTLPTSPYYNPDDAISELDFITEMVDTLDHADDVDWDEDDFHTATGFLVTQESFAWSFEPANDMIVFRYTLTPTRRISQSYFGMYAELTTGDKDDYENWPPSGWFRRHQLKWVDAMPEYQGVSDEPLNLCAEHHFSYSPGEHAGIKFMGAKFYPGDGGEVNTDVNVAWQWWNWDPGSIALDQDVERYALLSDPGIDDWTEILPLDDSPIMLLSGGPWEFNPPLEGQTPDRLVVTYAFLGGDTMDDLVANAIYAQEAYNKDFALPSPPHSPQTAVRLNSGKVTLYWEGSPELSTDSESGFDFEGYRIYLGRSAEESAFGLIKDYDLTDIPAANVITGEFSVRQDWLDSLVTAWNVEDEQSVLDQLEETWPGTDYLYHEGADPPFLVTHTDSVGYNTGLSPVQLAEEDYLSEWVNDSTQVTYTYAYTFDNLSDGHEYWAAVTSYDQGAGSVASLESGRSQNARYVIPGPGPEAWEAGRSVTVFPNPYRGSAVWDGNRAIGRYVWFAGLPGRATVQIYTLAGDLVYDFNFDRDTYAGENAAGVFPPDGQAPVLPGTFAAWDLRSNNGQPVSTGLYLFSVKDLDTGEAQQGKFLVLK
jgi:hypothetical protein